VKNTAQFLPVFYEVGSYYRGITSNTNQIISAGNQISGLMRNEDHWCLIPEGVDPELLMKVLGNPEMAALLTSLAKSMKM